MAYSINAKDFFNTKLYTGTGSSLALTGVGFQPDMVWQKVRSTTSSHRITDAVRGVGQVIYPNDTAQQSAESAVTAFGTDGFTVGTASGTNTNGATYVGWSWKAGTGQGSANTDGTINTTYTSVNTTSGVSISKFVGTGANATVGHGLGVVPSMYMVKKLDSSGSWGVYHKSLGATKSMFLDLNDTGGTHIDYWNNTEPTSSVFSVGTSSTHNYNGQNMIAYAFAEKTGFSKFGSYVGNGNADGAFIYTGFKPAFIIIKRYDSGTLDWMMFDNKRMSGYNPYNDYFKANENIAEVDNSFIDILSNGFKIRTSDDQVANNGGSFLYMSFAEAPLVGSNNVPATAR